MKTIVFLFAAFFGTVLGIRAEPIHVLVWDERQERQAEAYDNFLGNEIARRLEASSDELELRSVALDDPEQGVGKANLDWADVIIWWGHVRHGELTDENTKAVLDRVINGDLDLVVLHSAHWARPFVEAMNWRTREDARKHFSETDAGKLIKFEYVAPPKERTVPTYGSQVTPCWFGYRLNKTNYQAVVHLPYCCFPAYRPDGKPSEITVKDADHPIAKGLPATFQVARTEMYDEPFHVPDPDEVIFEETWEPGERFRAGMVWKIGKGKVFYFRPGHEQYPVFKQKEVIQVLENACGWLGKN